MVKVNNKSRLYGTPLIDQILYVLIAAFGVKFVGDIQLNPAQVVFFVVIDFGFVIA